MFIRPFQKSNLAMVAFGLQVVFMNLFSFFAVLVFVFAIEAFHDVSNVMWCNVVLKKRSSYHRWFQQVLASTNTVTGYRLIFFAIQNSGVTSKGTMLKGRVAVWCCFFLYDVFSRLAYKCAVNFSPFPNSHLDFFKGFPNPNAPKAILFM